MINIYSTTRFEWNKSRLTITTSFCIAMPKKKKLLSFQTTEKQGVWKQAKIHEILSVISLEHLQRIPCE